MDAESNKLSQLFAAFFSCEGNKTASDTLQNRNLSLLLKEKGLTGMHAALCSNASGFPKWPPETPLSP